MKFSELQIPNDVVKANISGLDANIKQYLSINDKYDLVMSTAEQSFEDGVFNPVKQEMFFNLNLIYLYTDIEFTEEEKEHPAIVYDVLEQNGVFNEVIAMIPSREVNMLYDMLKTYCNEKKEFNKSLYGVLKSFLNETPEMISKAGEQLNDFDINKYENVVSMAKAIGANI